MGIRLGVVLWCILLASSGRAESYDYPFSNPLVATVIGTPLAFQASLPAEIPVRQLELAQAPLRSIPAIFWYTARFKFSLVAQPGPAPLMFVIAGTGASHNAGKMQLLQRIFHQAGFHVVSLPSPTNPNFIVSASSTGVPGHIEHDSEDLYRVMRQIWRQLSREIQVTEFYLTGYSLGGAQAAFLARLDDVRRAFEFRKVLMINPPLSLYNSAKILDAMLADNIPGGLDKIHLFMDELFARLMKLYRDEDQVSLSDDFLYRIYQKQPPEDANLAALIGISFRLTFTNMLFASDVITDSGYLKPQGVTLSVTDSLTEYFKAASRVGFIEYFDAYFYAYFRRHGVASNRRTLLDSLSLRAIEDYLRRTDKITLMTNADDLILAPGEVDYLRRVFGRRAKIYPSGGHCGNLAYKDNVAFMTAFFEP